jgi:hypothetical protein
MADKQAAPGAVPKTRASQIDLDLTAGPLRCTARLSFAPSAAPLKAIWRNEVGPAQCTGHARA